MCWMTIRREYDALAHGIIHTREHESSNGHSYGFAWLEDGDIEVQKGVGEIPDVNPPLTEAALVHTRYATTGNIVEENAHPFEIEGPDGDVVAALAHNGTWYGAPSHEYFSDTWFMAREFEHLLERFEFEEALKELVRTTGETCVVLRDTGAAYAYSGRFSITQNGSVVASSGFNPIPSETITKLGPDGDSETIRVNDQYRISEWTEPAEVMWR